MEFKRTVDATLLAALTAGTGHPIAIVYIARPAGVIRAHSGTGLLVWQGQDWQGMGQIGRLDLPGEGQEFAPDEAEAIVILTLSDALAIATDDALRSVRFQAWSGLATSPGGVSLIGQPQLAFSGYVTGSNQNDSFKMEDPQGAALFRIRARAGQRARASAAVLHSNEDQQRGDPNDTFFFRNNEAGLEAETPLQW